MKYSNDDIKRSATVTLALGRALRDMTLHLPRGRGVRRIIFLSMALTTGSLLFSAPGPASGGDSRPPATYRLGQGERNAPILEPNKPVERELAGGQAHLYRLELGADQFAQVVVDQRGIDVEIVLKLPGGAQIVADSPNASYGPDPILWIAPTAGVYLLEVRAPGKYPIGRYEIKLAAPRPASQTERILTEAFRFYNQSARLMAARKYTEAITAGERAMEMQEQALGADHPDLALTLYNLASLYLKRAMLNRQPADYARAEPLFNRAVTIWEKEVGAETHALLNPLNQWAEVYKQTGKYPPAEALYLRVINLREKLLGPEHPDTAAARFNLGNLYFGMRELTKAEAQLETALKIFEATLGRKNIDRTLNCRFLLAAVYSAHDKYSEAERCYQDSLDIITEFRGPDHVDVADALNNFAGLYHKKGDYAQTERLHRRALRVRESKLPANHPDIAVSLHNLAGALADAGDYAQAEPMFERALEIKVKAYGPDHHEVATTLHDLGVFYSRKGDYAKAEQFHRRSLDIRKQTLPPDHPSIAMSLDDLGVIYARHGAYAQAEQCFKEALQIRRKLESDHPFIAVILDHLAQLRLDQGDYASADSLFKQAVDILERRLGADHPDIAVLLNNFAALHRKKGDYAQAEALYRRALEIRERRLGPDHLSIANSLYQLAMLNQAKGDLAQAVNLLTRCNNLREEHLRRTLGAGSERQKLAYLNVFERETNDTISLHAQDAPRNPAALNLAFTTLLRRKGRGLDAVADTLARLRLHATEQERAALDQLANARAQLAARTLRRAGAGNLGAYRSDIERLSAEIDKLEASLSAGVPEFQAPVTLAAVQAAIPSGAALVEFARYRPRAPLSSDSHPPRYAAYALMSRGEPRWVDLGAAGPIDNAVKLWREALGDSDRPDRQDARRLARDVDERVMRPVRALLGHARHVLLSPDGELNLIPFAALVDEQRQYLIKRYTFTYLTSGRDLLRLQSRAPSRGAPLIVAVPEFGATDAAGTLSTQPPARTLAAYTPPRDSERLDFPSLPPAMMDQARRIKNILPEATDLTGARATETALKQARGPSVLHIITHAFFLPNLKIAPANTSGVESLNADSATPAEPRSTEVETSLENRWLRSGLALTGANLRRSGDDDGLLTALEATGLDLWGTKLVVLSACETGLGKVENGEGVYGLRRALVLAGAESQVVTLWKISAEEMTGRLMTHYYQALQRGAGRGAALRQAQLKMIDNPAYRRPYFWAAFIHIGEWANLAGRRPASGGARQGRTARDDHRGHRARQSQTTER